MIYIETPRLLLRDWHESDLPDLIEMGKDPNVMRYFDGLLSEEQSIGLYNNISAHFTKWGYGGYAVEIKATNEFIGFIGLGHPTFESHFTPCIEIAWRLASHAWGKGYATEGAKAVIKYAFEELKLRELYAFTTLDNAPSYKVMKKIGMKKVATFVHPNLPIDHALSEHWIYHIKSTSIN